MADPDEARPCPNCGGRGYVTADIDVHGRRYINQPPEDREQPCDVCGGSGVEVDHG